MSTQRHTPGRRTWLTLAVLGVALGFLLTRRSSNPAGGSFIPGTPFPGPSPVLFSTASWYGPGFDGRLTASGEVFDQEGLTAAHRSLPFGTRLRVIDESGASVIVRVTDRGPFHKADGAFDRELDLSKGAARVLGMLDRGLARVRIERLS